MTDDTPSPVKRALLVGIDRYKSKKIRSLDGCVNDARLMHTLLQTPFGFIDDDDRMRVLENEDATRDNILRALDQLVEKTERNDVVVIYYAGHGSQMTDREGDEASGYDNTLMPTDSEGWSGENRDITDDELHLVLHALAEKTRYITLIVDACHSGTISRDAFGPQARGVRPDTRPISELPPSPILSSPRYKRRGAGDGIPLVEKYVLMAGCRDEEKSYEYDPPDAAGKDTHGAFTYFLAQALRGAVADSTYRDVFEVAAARVSANNPLQHPQMEGQADRKIFGIKDLTPMPHVLVQSRKGSEVTLNAGLAHGLTVGSLWDVHAQGTKIATAETMLGSIKITEVRAVRATAKVLPESKADAIEAGARAVEREHVYGEFRMPVQLVTAGDDAVVASMRKAIEASPLLQLVGPGDRTASLRVYLLEPRIAASTDDVVPQLGALAARTWAVVSNGGELVMPPKPVGDHAAVTANLKILALQRNALEIDKPNSALRGKFELDLYRRDAAGEWIPAPPDESGGLSVFEEDKSIGFSITSKHNEPVYVNLLDFGITGGISVLYPPLGSSDALGMKISFDVGKGGRDEDIAPTFPDNYPFTSDGPTEAIETVKLFVTKTPADFRFLGQTGTRSASVSSPFQQLLESAMGGGPSTRDISGARLPADTDDWTTVVRQFVLRRKRRPLSDGKNVDVGGVTVHATGLTAEVTSHASETSGVAPVTRLDDALACALLDAGATVRQTVELSNTQPIAGGRGGEPAVTLELRDIDPGLGAVVMHVDELGLVTWHFGDDAMPQGRSAGACRGARTFRVPIKSSSPSARPEGRGIGLGALSSNTTKQFLKLVVFPLIEPVIGVVANDYAFRWENQHRPYRVRTVTAHDYRTEGVELDAGDWSELAKGRALLLLHGTFGRTQDAFGALPQSIVDTLYERYQGRIFAFDHHTMSHDPRQNVDALLRLIPDGTHLELDVLCHERGGLVARVLAEQQGALPLERRTISVRKVVFAGTPNAGTRLADKEQLGRLIDTFSTVYCSLIPTPGTAAIATAIVGAVRVLATGGMGGLKGIAAMTPGGDFVKGLNSDSASADGRPAYFAIVSNFEPTQPGLKLVFANLMADKLFAGANDLIVPTESTYAANGSPYFPIRERLTFAPSDGVAHNQYFAASKAHDKIVEWLTG